MYLTESNIFPIILYMLILLPVACSIFWFAKNKYQFKYQHSIMVLTGLIFALSVWSIDFAILYSKLLFNIDAAHFNVSLITLSFLLITFVSISTLYMFAYIKHFYIKAILSLAVLVCGLIFMHVALSQGVADLLAHSYQAENIAPLSIDIILVYLFALLILAILILGILSITLKNQLIFQHSERGNLRQKLDNLVNEDPLTKLPNRHFLEKYTQQLFKRAEQQDMQLALLYINIDRFKMVNDVFGYEVGDQVLCAVSERIRSFIPAHMQLIRIGDDEFLLILENATFDSTIKMADQIIESAAQPYHVTAQDIHITSSIGIALYPQHGRNFWELFVNADLSVFLAKQKGGNHYRVFNHSLTTEKAKNEFRLEKDLIDAIKHKQFILYYQPKFDIHCNINGVEALIRWQHPKYGLIGPQKFVDVAEKTGLIVDIGYWVLEEAFEQIQQWEKNNKALYPIAVNLSALQFEHSMLYVTLETLISRYQIDPKHLLIEITETVAMRNIDLSIKSFQKLREMGIRIAIDDFGTGYSSFSYLKDLPIDELKIDRGFIVNLTADSKEEMILASIIELATKLGLTVTAEGIEHQQQAEILTRLGCKQLQGFLFAKPMPATQLDQYLVSAS